MKHHLVLFIFTFLIAPSLLLSTYNIETFSNDSNSKSNSNGINIGAMFKYVRKYDKLSKTNFGSFLNGFFMGIIEDVINEKSQIKCKEVKFWSLVKCLVGAKEVTLDDHYDKLKIVNYKNLPVDLEKNIILLGDDSKTLNNDSEIKQIMEDKPKSTGNSWNSYLRADWKSLSTKNANLIEPVKKKFKIFYEKLKGFFESYLLKGVSVIAKCVAPIEYKDFSISNLQSIFKFLGQPWLKKFLKVVMRAPFFFSTLSDMFINLKEIIKKKYSKPQYKYFNYGKGVAGVLDTIVKIYNTARKMKRFSLIFKMN